MFPFGYPLNESVDMPLHQMNIPTAIKEWKDVVLNAIFIRKRGRYVGQVLRPPFRHCRERQPTADVNVQQRGKHMIPSLTYSFFANWMRREEETETPGLP